LEWPFLGRGGSLHHFPPFSSPRKGFFFSLLLFCFMPGFDGNHLEFHHSITQQSQWNVPMDGHVHVIINRTPGMKIDGKNEKEKKGMMKDY
jgi:hypothetical protein